ncbi:MAG: thioredoxin family protein [Candidatus Paceibacterota bacterium]
MKGFRKYFIALLITAALFAVAFFFSQYLTNRKIAEIKEAQNQVTTDILSSEAQFDLLQELSCQDVGNNYLSTEISNLADKITYGEQNFNDQRQLNLLKQQYSILEVKDFLLTKRISERCKQNTVTILYFYKNADVCDDCVKQGYVLDTIHQQYPALRIYSFDASLDSSTVRALLTIYKISDKVPSLVINGKTENGYIVVDELKKLLPTSLTNPTPLKTTTSATKAVSSTKTSTAK